MRKAFAIQKFLIFFNKKDIGIFQILSLKLNETLTNDVVNFEQLGPDFELKVKSHKN